jgi:hypothetical protein
MTLGKFIHNLSWVCHRVSSNDGKTKVLLVLLDSFAMNGNLIYVRLEQSLHPVQGETTLNS